MSAVDVPHLRRIVAERPRGGNSARRGGGRPFVAQNRQLDARGGDSENPPVDLFAQIVGPEHVRTDAETLRRCSGDLFVWPQSRVCRAVVAPGSPEEVVRVVRAAAAIGCGIVCRGGGTSWNGGCVPHEDEAIVLDLRRLDRIRVIEAADQYVTAEAGCTWSALLQSLEVSGLRPVLEPFGVRANATLGGLLSMQAPDDCAGVLGVEAVTGAGKLICTGSAARSAHPVPFFRQFGPDLTALLLGDGGRFAVKTAVTLALEPLPAHTAQAAFAFATFEALMRAVVACCRLRTPARLLGLDPAALRGTHGEAAAHALRAALSRGRRRRLIGALGEVLSRPENGEPGVQGDEWTLHVSAEAVSARGARDVIEALREHCLREGREIVPCLPAGRGSPARELIGPEGERWVPTSAAVPFSMAETAATRVRQLFGVHRARMQGFGMWESCTVVPRAGAVIIEPCIYWHDELSAAHLEQPDVVSAGKSGSAIHFPEAREFAIELRARLTDLFAELGAVHLEPGKAHPFRSLLAPQTAEALERVRQAFDPDDRLNPGNLER